MTKNKFWTKSKKITAGISVCAVALLGFSYFAYYNSKMPIASKASSVPKSHQHIKKTVPVITTKEMNQGQKSTWSAYKIDSKMEKSKPKDSIHDMKVQQKMEFYNQSIRGLIYKDAYDTETDDFNYDFYIPYAVPKGNTIAYVETSPLGVTNKFNTSIDYIQKALAQTTNDAKNVGIRVLYGNQIVASTDTVKERSIKNDEKTKDGYKFFTSNYEFTPRDLQLHDKFFDKHNKVMKDIIKDDTITFDSQSYMLNQPDNKVNPLPTVGTFKTSGDGSVSTPAPANWKSLSTRDREQFYYQIERAIAPFVYESKTFPTIKITDGDATVATSQ